MHLELGKGEAANLLSLDGGGVKGISTLVILQAIMDKVQEIETGQKPTLPAKPTDRKPMSTDRKPIDYFHLAGGTSTGGIVALMLFRLNMSPQEAIDAYTDMGKKIFGTKVKGQDHNYAAEPLLAAIDSIVTKYGPEQDKSQAGKAPLVVNRGGRMFMCATMQERGESILLRSYTPPPDAVPVSKDGKALRDADFANTLTIAEGTRATSAAPIYFPALEVPVPPGPDGKPKKVVLWDGGLLNNNPIDQVWRARLDLVGLTDPAPKVACVLSIGTSFSDVGPPGMIQSFLPKKSEKGGVVGLAWNALVSAMEFVGDKITNWIPMLNPAEKALPFLTNTEAKHLDFSRYMNRLKNRQTETDGKTPYFRFNTPLGQDYMDMSDYKQMDWLADKTRKWLLSDDAKGYVNDCAKILAKPKATK